MQQELERARRIQPFYTVSEHNAYLLVQGRILLDRLTRKQKSSYLMSRPSFEKTHASRVISGSGSQEMINNLEQRPREDGQRFLLRSYTNLCDDLVYIVNELEQMLLDKH